MTVVRMMIAMIFMMFAMIYVMFAMISMMITTSILLYSSMIITAAISRAIDQEGSEQWSPAPEAHWDCLLTLTKHPRLPSFNTQCY